MENVVSEELAIETVESWLDVKKVNAKKRIENEKLIQELVGLVQDGTLVLTDKFHWKHKLIFPIGENEQIKELIYKPRISVEEIIDGSKGVKQEELGLVYISILTGQVKGIIKKLDLSDYTVSQIIAGFFL